MSRADEASRHVGAIELTTEEKAIASRINFGPTGYEGPDNTDKNGDAVCALLDLLMARQAIPVHRLKYFNDPGYNAGGRGKSHKQVFESNGCRGENILRHNHFLTFFHYMVYGAKLPAFVTDSLRQSVEDCGQVTSSDIGPLVRRARQLARSHIERPADAGEEFYKLALDLGFDPATARFFRNSVRAIR